MSKFDMFTNTLHKNLITFYEKKRKSTHCWPFTSCHKKYRNPIICGNEIKMAKWIKYTKNIYFQANCLVNSQME